MTNELEDHQLAIEQELSKLPEHVQDRYCSLQSELKTLSSEAQRWKKGVTRLGKKLQLLEGDLRRSPTKMREFELHLQIKQLTTQRIEIQAGTIPQALKAKLTIHMGNPPACTYSPNLDS